MKTITRSQMKHIKRIASLVLAFALLLTLAACGSNEERDETGEGSIFESITETIENKETESAVTADTTPPATEPPATERETIESAPDDVEWTPITETEEINIIGGDTPTYDPAPVPNSGGIAPLALMYHLILDQPYSALENLFVRPSELRGHIEALLEKGYTFIFADEFAYSDTKTVIMSFDDGYLDNYTEMFPIIKEYNVKVTVFMITDYIGGPDYLSESMIKEMASSGLVSFQSHTASHPALPTVSDDTMRYEFTSSNERLESLTGRPVKALCYPTGAFDARTVAIAQDYYNFAYTTVSTNSTAGYSLMELPRLRVNRGVSKEGFASMIP